MTDGQQPSPAAHRSRRARLGTVVLLVAMVGTAILAALSVTPRPDEESLARPADSDVVMAGVAPVTWDPARMSDAGSAQLLSQVFEGLTALDETARVRPALAESWSLEEGGRQITFRLRPGLTFSDGSPLGAEDVRRSWLRVLDPADPSPLASLLGDVVGAAAFSRGEAQADDVAIVADGDTLSVRFERPAAYFPAIAAVPTLAVVPAGIDSRMAAGDVPLDLPVSGAYRPEGTDATEIRLGANPSYWAGDPPVGRVTVLTDDGGRSNVDVFEDEAVDWVPISPDDAAWIRYDRDLGPQLRWSDQWTVEYLGFDTTRPPFDDPDVRRAVGMAVDWRRLARGQAEGRTPATTLVPPGIAGRPDGDYLPEHDPQAARELLAQAGYPGGEGFPRVALATYGAGAAEAIAHEVERELGIEVDVEARPFSQHADLLDADTPPMWTLAWNADYPHVHDFLGLLLRSDSSANAGGWSDPAYDALIDQAASTTDVAEQARLYDAAQRLIGREVPVVPLAYGGSWALSREGLLGAIPSGVGILRYAGLAWQG